MSHVRRVAASAFCAALFSMLLPAQGGGDHAAPKPGDKAPANAAAPKATFVVARTGERLEVMSTTQFIAHEKRLADEYAAAMAKYEKDRKAAEDAGKPFATKPPSPTSTSKVGAEYTARADAEAALKKLREDEERAKAEAKKPESAPAAPKPGGEGGKKGGSHQRRHRR